MDRAKQPGIEIGQIVVERASFSHRDDYLALPGDTKVPPLPLRLSASYGSDATKQHGAIKVELTTDRSQNPLYNVDVTVVGLIRVVEGAANMPLEQYAAVHGGALLFPFIRELVANLTGRGRFGPVWLQPVNLAASLPREAERGTVAEAPARYRSKRRKG